MVPALMVTSVKLLIGLATLVILWKLFESPEEEERVDEKWLNRMKADELAKKRPPETPRSKPDPYTPATRNYTREYRH